MENGLILHSALAATHTARSTIGTIVAEAVESRTPSEAWWRNRKAENNAGARLEIAVTSAKFLEAKELIAGWKY